MNRSYLLSIITIILWGSTAAISSLMLESLSTLALVFYGSLTAACFLLALNLVTGRLRIMKSLRARDYLTMFIAGMLGIFLYNELLFFGMTRLLAQQAFIINYLWPIFIVIFSCLLLKEKLTVIKSASMLLSFAGVAVAAAAVLLFTGGIPVLNAAQIPGILWTGVLIYGVAFSLWSIAIALGNTAKISNLAYLTPFVSLIWIYFLVGEPITMASVVGLLIIVAGVILQMFDKK